MKINNNEQNPIVQKLSQDCRLILDDKKYFTLSGHVPGNNQYCSFDPSSAPTNIQKYEPVCLAISCRRVFSLSIHCSKISIRI